MVICPEAGDNISKGMLIPHVVIRIRCLMIKDLSLREEPASHQLVGKVTAYQGNDG